MGEEQRADLDSSREARQPEEKLFGQILINLNLASRDQIEAALAEQQRLASRGIRVRLGQILVDNNVIPLLHLLLALGLQGKVPMLCHKCQRVYNVKQYREGHSIPCPRCGVDLYVPELEGLRKSVDASETTFLPTVNGDTEEEAVYSGTPFGPLTGSGQARYRLLEELGGGEGGVFHMAWDTQLKRMVALKRMRLSEAENPGKVQRFLNETTAAVALRHSSIIAVHDAGKIGEEYYLAMDPPHGLSYREHLDRTREHRRQGHKDGYSELRREIKWLIQAARAVHSAHKYSIIHRDLKPANIFVGRDEKVCVAYFGLAKEEHLEKACDASAPAPSPSQARGEEEPEASTYMSPELVADAYEPTPAADVYSLGSILYETLTGRHVFEQERPAELLARIAQRKPERPSRLNRLCPRELEAICLKCLEKEPGRRYQSALELAEDLNRWLRGAPIRAQKPSVWRRTSRWLRRR